MFLQYRGTLSDNSKVAVGVLLFAANIIMLMGPVLIIGLIAIRALPSSLVQRFLGDDEPQVVTDAPAVTDATATNGESTDKIGEVIFVQRYIELVYLLLKKLVQVVFHI